MKELAFYLFHKIWRRGLFSRVRENDGVCERRFVPAASLSIDPQDPVCSKYSQIWSTNFRPPNSESSTCQVEKEEISKHLEDSKVNVKGYNALFDDAVEMAKVGTVFWLDPGKPASQPLSIR